MDVGIHNYSLQRRLETLETTQISNINKKLIMDFVDELIPKLKIASPNALFRIINPVSDHEK